ncbi:uncharacterized protein LOC113226481 isoform X2 [Hyposmocoma kahamanoa]|uniref:uncharacterized protein LOC113226481 isoform X2 n=1 Tax=Hyposmocoma kahamanoa TaxID=1477025 RepID=UPI000E6D89F4|nr:uncharacterized protein LOC113226481 isoform X2 [Hyposmocoma kahamanoa]
MRRGHPGIGGWRGDNPRHFRPRSGGTPNFRPPRGFGLVDQPRFTGPRSLLGHRPFRPYPAQINHITPEKDRNSYRRSNNQQRSQNHSYGQQRQIFPMLQRIRQGQVDTTKNQHNDLSNQYNDNTSYYNNQPKQCHINNLGDIDHRQTNIPQNREFNQHPTVWVNPPAFFAGNQNKPFTNYDKEQTKVPLFDYTGHRPPSSDHYGGNLGSTIDNSNTFSRSVDDTVDIVRKRLQRRGSQHALDNNIPPVDQTEETPVRETTLSSYSNVHSQPEQPVKKKITRTRNVKKEISTTIYTPEKSKNPVEKPYTVRNAFQIKKEIDTQLHNMAKSPLKFSSKCEEPRKSTEDTKQEAATYAEINPKQMVDSGEKTDEHQESSSDFKHTERNTDKRKSSTLTKSSTLSRKRSVEEKPSHRKEKRKKSESEQMHTESNKQVLNKNIIINVNDCAAKSTTEKCDAPKSIFNLFFSKEKSGNNSSKENKLDKSIKISDKHIKRKEEKSSNKSKDKGSDKKKHDSISSRHSTLSPTETNVANSSAQTPTKGDSKLKTIDMFLDHPKKPNVHQAHRNTAPVATLNTAVMETVKPPLPINRKIIKRHISTQVIQKTSHKETQTMESKSSTSRFCQTERKKLMTRGMQTEPDSFRSTSKTTDAFERMKEIDMEIQTLLQEKFKLYSSIESKEGCPSNTMQSLGMAVLNVAPLNENYLNDDAVEDAIVDDFTNIPVEELEQIAFETVQEEKGDNAQERRSLRHKVLQRQRKSSLSPATTSSTNTRTKRKAKTPNISLIEQIITDDRPLEDIISLDYLEVLPVPTSKSYKKYKAKPKSKPNKKCTKQIETSSKTDNYALKECSVVLVRDDLESMLKSIIEFNKQNRINKVDETSNITESGTDLSSKTEDIVEQENVDEETIVSDIQFDMLDVSEDIVIGDSCEVKSSEKDENYTSPGSINEEIILDNSQQSIEEASCAEIEDKSQECRVYDFLSDENLRRDSIIVSGNADAVLAIECIENNFIAACLDGNVYYFTGEGQLLNTLRGSNLAVTCLTIVKEKYGTTVYTGSLDSRIRYYDLETGLEKGPECNVLSPIQTMDRAWDTVFVGTRTGFVLQFECKNNMLIPVSTVKFSEQSILALRAMKEGPRKVLLVAARSEAVTIKDAQTGLLLRTLEGPKMTVYTLLFEDGKVYCGTSSPQIHVFDYASGSHVGTHDGGKGAVCLRATGGLLFAGCYDGCVYVYREGDSRALAQLRGPSLMLLSLAIVGTKIIAGYKDRSLYIWKMPLAVLQEMIL